MHETDMTIDLPELVRQTTVRVLDERIRLLGVDRSGAYEHYKAQLSLGFPIRAGELAILKFVRERLPKLRSYHEIGSGLGTLPLMLACDNLTAVGVERDEKRHLTALAILRELSDAVPQVEGNCRLIGGSFPDVVSDLDVSESLAILTDIVATQTPRDAARFGHALARYRYVVMDLQRFCTKRDSAEEQDRLIEELDQCGLSAREEIADLDSQGRYMLFESRVASEKRPLPGDKPRAPLEKAAPQKTRSKRRGLPHLRPEMKQGSLLTFRWRSRQRNSKLPPRSPLSRCRAKRLSRRCVRPGFRRCPGVRSRGALGDGWASRPCLSSDCPRYWLSPITALLPPSSMSRRSSLRCVGLRRLRWPKAPAARP